MTESVAIADIGKRYERFRRDLGDIGELARSICRVGMLHPVVLDSEGNLIAGGRRIAAAETLGWDEVPVTYVEGLAEAAELIAAERDENTCRADFKPTEMVALADRLAELERPKATERLRAAGELSPSASASGNLPKADAVSVRDATARAAGTSGRTLAKARKVVETANDETAPEPVRAAAIEAQAEMDATGKVDASYNKVRDAEAAQEIADSQDGLAESRIDYAAVRYRRKWWATVNAAHKIDEFKPLTDVVAACRNHESDDELLEMFVRTLRGWADELEEAISAPLPANVTELRKDQ